MASLSGPRQGQGSAYATTGTLTAAILTPTIDESGEAPKQRFLVKRNGQYPPASPQRPVLPLRPAPQAERWIPTASVGQGRSIYSAGKKGGFSTRGNVFV